MPALSCAVHIVRLSLGVLLSFLLSSSRALVAENYRPSYSIYMVLSPIPTGHHICIRYIGQPLLSNRCLFFNVHVVHIVASCAGLSLFSIFIKSSFARNLIRILSNSGFRETSSFPNFVDEHQKWLIQHFLISSPRGDA